MSMEVCGLFGRVGTIVVAHLFLGAYFFGSVDEHRYQLQRHARKLQARVFARKDIRMRMSLLESTDDLE